MFCEMSPQLGASYGSPRQFQLVGIRDVCKALFQLWLSSHAPAIALQALFHHEGCAVPTVTLAERVTLNSFMIKDQGGSLYGILEHDSEDGKGP